MKVFGCCCHERCTPFSYFIFLLESLIFFLLNHKNQSSHPFTKMRFCTFPKYIIDYENVVKGLESFGYHSKKKHNFTTTYNMETPLISAWADIKKITKTTYLSFFGQLCNMQWILRLLATKIYHVETERFILLPLCPSVSYIIYFAFTFRVIVINLMKWCVTQRKLITNSRQLIIILVFTSKIINYITYRYICLPCTLYITTNKNNYNN